MKKGTKRFLITGGSLVAVLIAAVVLMGLKMQSETKKMHPLETGNLISGISTVKDQYVNVYFIKNHDHFIVIDAGVKAALVKKGMEQLGINPEMVTNLLLTHTDYDHTGALSLFPKATVYISAAEEQMINGKTSRGPLMKNHLCCKYKKIEDNQTVVIDSITVKGILNPGHTPGSMSYLVNDTCLFTGDAMGLANNKITEFSRFFNMNSAVALESIKKLVKLQGIRHAFTAHDGSTDNFTEAAAGFGN